MTLYLLVWESHSRKIDRTFFNLPGNKPPGSTSPFSKPRIYARCPPGSVSPSSPDNLRSPRYGVAALGNIATHPEHREQKYTARVTARCCQSLLESVARIGLNVRADNQAAITCYQKLGFRIKAEYEEFTIKKKLKNSPKKQ